MEEEKYQPKEEYLTTDQGAQVKTKIGEHEQNKRYSLFCHLAILIIKEIIRALEEALVELEEKSKAPRVINHGWFSSIFGIYDDLSGETTEELEKALARYQEKPSGKSGFLDDEIMSRRVKHALALELLMRKNPEVRELHNRLKESKQRKKSEQRTWEKRILDTQGEEELKRRQKNGEGPEDQYTREELEMNVRLVQAEVDAGITHPAYLKHTEEERDAGGFYNWYKEFTGKIHENRIKEMTTEGDPDRKRILENIKYNNEWRYGKDYANQQFTILAKVAGIIVPETSSTKIEC